jgi:hypothetical protein
LIIQTTHKAPMPPNSVTPSEEILYVDQDFPLADFTFDSMLGWYQSPQPYRVLISLEQSIRPGDLRQGMRLAARLSWEVVQGKRWRHVRVLRVIPPAPSNSEGAPPGPVTEIEPTNFTAFLARAPRSDRPGGARGAVGRRALVAGETTEAHSITLPASVWRRLEQIGDGNRSEGVRRLADECRGTAVKEPG